MRQAQVDAGARPDHDRRTAELSACGGQRRTGRANAIFFKDRVGFRGRARPASTRIPGHRRSQATREALMACGGVSSRSAYTADRAGCADRPRLHYDHQPGAQPPRAARWRIKEHIAPRSTPPTTVFTQPAKWLTLNHEASRWPDAPSNGLTPNSAQSDHLRQKPAGPG